MRSYTCGRNDALVIQGSLKYTVLMLATPFTCETLPETVIISSIYSVFASHLTNCGIVILLRRVQINLKIGHNIMRYVKRKASCEHTACCIFIDHNQLLLNILCDTFPFWTARYVDTFVSCLFSER